MSVVVVGLNLAVELSFVVPVLELATLTATSFTKVPGGKGTTVARLISALGGCPQLVTLLPRGSAEIKQQLEREGVVVLGVPVDMELRYSVVVGEEDGARRLIVRLPGKASSGVPAELLLHKAEDALRSCNVLVIAGSLPYGVPLSFVAQLCHLAKTRNVTTVADLTGPVLREAAISGVSSIKINRREFHDSFGHQKDSSLQAQMRTVSETYRCDVVVTDGAGSVCGVDELGAFRIDILRKQVSQLTAGAGDTTTAGLAWAITQGRSYRDSVRFGVGLGVAAASLVGSGVLPNPLPRMSELVGPIVSV